MTNQRLMDLVRRMRMELFTEGLLSEDEYAALASIDSNKHHARLADYDEIKVENGRFRRALKKISDCDLPEIAGVVAEKTSCVDCIRIARKALEEP